MVLRNLAKFTEKHLCQSLFLNKVAGQNSQKKMVKKETLKLAFSCEFCKISKNAFFTEHVRVTAFDNVCGVFRTLANTCDTLHCVKKFLYSEFFWSVFSRIWTDDGMIRSISTYSVRIRENPD